MNLSDLIKEIKKRYPDITIQVDYNLKTDALFQLKLWMGRTINENKLDDDFYFQEDSPDSDEFGKELLKRVRIAYSEFSEPDRDDDNLFG